MWSTVIWFQNFVQNSNIISCTSLSHRRPYNSKMRLKNHATFSKCEKEKFFSYFEMEIYYTYGECDEIFRQFQHALRYRDDSMTCNYQNNIFWNLCLWILYLLKKMGKNHIRFFHDWTLRDHPQAKPRSDLEGWSRGKSGYGFFPFKNHFWD